MRGSVGAAHGVDREGSGSADLFFPVPPAGGSSDAGPCTVGKLARGRLPDRAPHIQSRRVDQIAGQHFPLRRGRDVIGVNSVCATRRAAIGDLPWRKRFEP